MKYLLNIVCVSAVLLFAVACNKEDETIVSSESEISNADFLALSKNENASVLKNRNPEMLFKIFDKNNDGKISKEETENAPKKKLAEKFDFLDGNSDGFIDKEEAAKLSSMIQNGRKGKRNPEMLFKILDKDNDGKISLEEAENAPKKKLAENFDLIDGNSDGFIDKEEVAKLSSMIQNGRKGKPNPEMIFKFLDRDKDGKLSRAEAENAPKKKLAENFDLIDGNSDGFIDKEELMNLSKNRG